MNYRFHAGWGEADITPDADAVVMLVGQYYQRTARGLHSRLKAVALVVTQGNACAAFVTLDSVGFTEEYARRIQKAVSQAIPEIPEDALLLNAIHTHNAPGLKPLRPNHVPPEGALLPEAYQEQVEAGVVEAVKAAWASRKPAGTAPVLEYARIGHCRRAMYADGTVKMYGRTDRPDFLGMEGGEDSGVDLLFFLDEDRNPTGVILNVPCPAQVLEAGYEISSDFMGAVRERLNEEYGPDFFTLCQVGAGGCQSPRDLTRSYRGEPDFWHAGGVTVLAERLVEAVRRGIARTAETYDPTPVLASSTTPLSLPRRRVTYPAFRASRSALARLMSEWGTVDNAFEAFCAEVKHNESIPDRPGPYDDKGHPFSLIRIHEAVIRRYQEQDAQPAFPMDLHVVRMGSVVFAGNPFELFLEYGQRMKARSPAEQTFVVQLANGAGSYLPSPKAEALGGYGGLVVNGQVGADGGALLVDRTLEEIEALWS